MIVYWFRKSLRLHDNPSFNLAWKEAQSTRQTLICLFSRDLLYRHAGPFRKTFLDRMQSELARELIRNNISFVVTDDAASLWLQQHQANSIVFTEILPGTEEALEFEQVREVVGVERVHSVWQRTLFPIEKISSGVASLPEVFSDFYRRIVVKLNWPIPNLETVGGLRGDENSAEKRLAYYVWQSRAVSNYKETRNGLMNDLDSSRLSPYLSVGRISANQIYQEVRRYETQYGSNASTEAFIYELIWRDYFQFYLLKFGSKVFQKNGIQSEMKWPGQKLCKGEEEFHAWVNGQTRNRFINAHMNELRQTGWMSNRGRQVVASYLIHDLHVDWRRGARYFEKTLIDDDVASNWGNWNYLAGVGADPRKNRYFDPHFQASRYDPDGAYQKKWA